jgi:hypothetical protein
MPPSPRPSGGERKLEESDRAAADLARVQSIAAILDPAAEPNSFTKVVPDGASVEDNPEFRAREYARSLARLRARYANDPEFRERKKARTLANSRATRPGP